MNIAAISGNLTRDPELRTTPSGVPVCTVRLAVNGMGRGGREEAGYINVVSFGAGAEAAAKVLTKGWLVEVQNGRLEWHEWTDKHDQTRESYQVIGDIKFLAAPKEREDGFAPATDVPAEASDFAPAEQRVPVGAGAGNTPAADDDIPF
ncbi:single-strand binding protein [Solirubrobacter pauli]|uniref:Single-stranded DNA-binding protein n=1 Tax=Solirubrobacter pauli TaxID=166793 RepID=A0A660L663_9ACTN|nr:single-stranded DNA-binding protein [Solirubrobacter pauli]RKQ90508.1 single-strand binding protein [Solirubrobacter pauli]